MTQKQVYGYGYRLLRSLFISGIISFVLPVGAIAQRIPIADDTLGNERSVVSPDEVINGRLSNRVNGGARRGTNLFHSFQEFNIDNGRGAYFSNPDGVANILARVTGGTRSDILGTLGIDGSANLFLLNPNGILFGPNAQLDIRGSFIASTANSFLFDNDFAFSATDPQAPPLLTVNVPIGLQYGGNPGEVRSQGANLQVQNGQTLTLAGGVVTVSGGRLLAPGGRVELTGMAAPGEVGLTQQGQEWRLSVPDGLARADVAILNNGFAGGFSSEASSIAINAQNLTVSNSGLVISLEGSNSLSSQGGNIDINVEGTTSVENSRIASVLAPESIGQSGNINITTGTLSLANRSQVLTTTFGQGDAGDITITAGDAVLFDGLGGNGFSSGVVSVVNTGAIGQGGDIRITTGRLSFTNGGFASANAEGQGNAGNIIITVRDTVSFDGIGSDGFSSGAYSSLGAIGRGGNIRITTGRLLLTNGGRINARTFGQGNAGNITIMVRDTVFFGGSDDNGVSSGAYSLVQPGAIGRGGDIDITADSLSLFNGAQINASTFGRGDAGSITIAARDAVFFNGSGDNGVSGGAASEVATGATGRGGDININAGTLSLINGADVRASTSGQGDAGNIVITARGAVSFNGLDRQGYASNASTSVESEAVGQGGDIHITADSLSLSNGATIDASTFGRGDAGDITITVRDIVSFDGVRSDGFASGAISVVYPGAIGQGGDINITTGTLSLTDEGLISASTGGQGDAGNITITASNAVSFGGIGTAGFASGVFSRVLPRAIGQGGDIRINTGELSFTNGTNVSVATLGRGNAGNIILTASDAMSFDGVGSDGVGSGAISTVESGAIGRGGNIRITADLLSLTNGAQVNATTRGQGGAGNIFFNVSTLTVAGRARVLAETSSTGNGGSIVVNAPTSGGNIAIAPSLVQLENGATIAVNSQGRGTGGNITLRSDQLVLNQSSITAETDSTRGGNITLQVPDLLLLRNRSRISTTAGTAQAGGDGGNINFDGQFIVAVPNENSDISANAFTGQGGNVSINAESLLGIEFRSQPTPLSDITASSTFGAPGAVSINTPNVDPNRGVVQLPTDITDASRLIAQTCPTGDVADTQSNEFVITGRGGLPPTPNEAVNQDAIQVDLVTTHADESSISQTEPSHYHPSRSPESPVVEAQGWQVATNGEVMLVAAVPQPATAMPPLRSNPSPHRLAQCP